MVPKSRNDTCTPVQMINLIFICEEMKLNCSKVTYNLGPVCIHSKNNPNLDLDLDTMLVPIPNKTFHWFLWVYETASLTIRVLFRVKSTRASRQLRMFALLSASPWSLLVPILLSYNSSKCYHYSITLIYQVHSSSHSGQLGPWIIYLKDDLVSTFFGLSIPHSCNISNPLLQ